MCKKSVLMCLLGLFLAIFVSSVSGVSGTQVWNASLGEGTSTNWNGAAVDSSDNSLHVGYYDNGARMAEIAKYDTNGVLQWNDSISVISEFKDVVADSGDNVYAVGRFSGIPLLVKYNSTGSYMWNETFTNVNSGIWMDVAVDNNGDIVAVGYGETGGNKIGIVAKYDNSSNQIWNFTIPSSSENIYIFDLDVDSNDNFFVGIRVGDDGWAYDLWRVIKYNSTGSQKWNFSYLGEGNWEESIGIGIDSNDDVIAVEKHYDPSYNKNLTFFKFNNSGTQLWNRTTFIADHMPFELKLDLNNNILVAMAFSESFNKMGYWKYNPDGELLYNVTFSRGITDSGFGIAFESDNDIILSGGGNSSAFITRTVIKFTDGLPTWNAFQGVSYSTDLNVVSDPTSVPNLILANTTSYIGWDSNVNVSGQNLDSFINVGQGYVSLNVSQLDSSFNDSAVVLMSGVNCLGFDLYYATGFHSSLAGIKSAGTRVATETDVGGNCTDDSICRNVECQGTTLTFKAQHFDGFGGDGGDNRIPEFSTITMLVALVIVISGFV
ncbi:hypothetical protein ACFLYT_00910, partial [Nanoarchaeota archaeon]